MKLEKQLEKLEQQLNRIKPEKIIRNTPDGIRRMEAVRREVPWLGREIAMKQEQPSY